MGTKYQEPNEWNKWQARAVSSQHSAMSNTWKWIVVSSSYLIWSWYLITQEPKTKWQKIKPESWNPESEGIQMNHGGTITQRNTERAYNLYFTQTFLCSVWYFAWNKANAFRSKIRQLNKFPAVLTQKILHSFLSSVSVETTLNHFRYKQLCYTCQPAAYNAILH